MSDVHFVLTCAACRRVRDDYWGGASALEWCTLQDFLRRHRACTDDVTLSECYCPDCALSYDRLVRYGQSQLDAPF